MLLTVSLIAVQGRLPVTDQGLREKYRLFVFLLTAPALIYVPLIGVTVNPYNLIVAICIKITPSPRGVILHSLWNAH